MDWVGLGWIGLDWIGLGEKDKFFNMNKLNNIIICYLI
uniref:Uncharacterized protein n=1 Tax=viral metagenome TaxID=1070528 RepID=A0A6C0KFX6_9ZZZZ